MSKFGIKAGDINDPDWVVNRLIDIAYEINKLIREVEKLKKVINK